ncbi:Rne/Rng family ribonuclease [Phycicoccus sp. Soil748]|uniref:Rne/Rng family ribonuclease n=1 Tax=Phycicoccus sp. Soil748 TaxID=1736397 RepID=UPI0009E836F8|nr:Rne/Rng family ribonuclease [Phycicoccus sp. Soil748]
MASTEDHFSTTDSTDGSDATSAPAAAESPQQVAEAAAAEAAGGAPAGKAPARKRAARRATKKTSAPAPVESADGVEVVVTDATADHEATDLPAVAADAAPAKKTARKAAAKKTAKKAPAKRATKKADPKADGEPLVEGAPVVEGAAVIDEGALVDPAPLDVPVPAGVAADADPETDADADDEAEEEARAAAEAAAQEATATVPSFGLLFQPPDPAKAAPRRRRASAAAGAPAPAPAPAEVPAVEAPAADGAPADGRGASADEETQAERPSRGRARGRGRGRGAKNAEDKGSEETTSDEAVAAPSGDDGQTDGQDSTSDDESTSEGGRRRRRRGGKGRGRGRGQGDAESADSTAEGDEDEQHGPEGEDEQSGEAEGSSTRRRRRRRRSGSSGEGDDPPGTVTKVREARRERDEPQSVKGSTRLEAKKQRRREGREAGRRRTIITEAEFLARRESVERVMVVREREGRTQIGVLEDDVLVEHYVSRETNASMAGNIYLGRVQNVLPSMEAAFVDIGKGRNAVLYAGEVNWDAAGLDNNQPKRIENALKSGDSVLVQVTKDPIGHKGARLTSQISLPGRYLVYVPEGSMTGISRKLPDTERARLKGILKEVVPDRAGVIVRTAAEGASEEELRADVERLTRTWEKIQAKADSKSGGKGKGGAPVLVHGEPDLTVRVIRDVFNEDFTSLVVAGDQAYGEVSDYLGDVAPDLAERLHKWTSEEDLFTHYRVDEQIAKAMDRKVWLPSGGSLVIDRTEAMTVVDVNTGKFVGSGGNLEETVTKNNIEAAEEIVRQLRLRDIGGIIVIDFIDMVLESNRDLVVRRLLECLGRDRTKHQVAEVTSLGLVQMTRKRVGSGLIEIFSENCEHCGGRGIIVHADPVDKPSGGDSGSGGGQSQRGGGNDGGNTGGTGGGSTRGRRGGRSGGAQEQAPAQPAAQAAPVHGGPTPAQIAAAAHAAALKSAGEHHDEDALLAVPGQDEPVVEVREAAGQDAPVALPAVEPLELPEGPAAEVRPVADEPAAEVHPVGDEPAAPAEPEQPVAAAAAEAPAAPKRRKRGRVVAPAGPPRPVGEDAAEPSVVAVPTS